MLRTLLLAALLAPLNAAQDFPGFELAADFNTENEAPLFSFPRGLDGSAGLGALAFYRADTVVHGLELYAVELGKPATLLADVAPGPVSGAGVGAVVHGGALYFSAWSPATGTEIWVTDGTPAGTHLWADLRPGVQSVGPQPQLAVPGGFVYTAQVSGPQTDLVFTNGTPGFEVKLTALDPSESVDPSGPFHVAASGLVYFVVDSSATTGAELWVADGSVGGAHLVRDIATGTQDVEVRALRDFGGLTYASLLNRASNRTELWSTDGTTANTQLVMDLGGQFSNCGELAVFAGKLIISGSTAAAGAELWTLDAPGGVPQLMTDVNPPGIPNAPIELTPLGGQLLFTLYPQVQPAAAELWALGGAPLSAQLVADLHPTGASQPAELTVAAGRAYFSAEDPAHGRELWSTDGTAAGTWLEADLVPGPESSLPTELVGVPGGLLFRATTPAVGYELFQVAGGAVALHTDIETGVVNGDADPGDQRAVFARNVYVAAMGAAARGREPHALLADGSAVELGDLNPGPASSDPRDFTGLVQAGQQRVAFTAQPPGTTRDMYTTDGSAAGTQALGLPGMLLLSDPSDLTAVRDRLYFVARNLAAELELWRTDGTLLGTHQVTQPGAAGEREPRDLVVVGPDLYFSARDDAGFRNVFRTDGTVVTQVSFQAHDAANGVEQLANVRGRLVFTQRGPGGARFVVHDPITGTSATYPQGLGFHVGTNQAADARYAPTVRGSRYYVFGFDNVQGWGYRSLDVDAGATVVLGSTVSGTVDAPSDGYGLRFIGALGYFVGDGPKGVELYRLTNAPLSTQLVYNGSGFDAGQQTEGSSAPSELTAVGDDLYFVVEASDTPALFRDVLTTSGGLVTSACELSAFSFTSMNPRGLTLANGALHFTGEVGEAFGSELLRRTELGAHVVDFGTNASGGVLEVDSPILGTSVGVYLRNQAPGTVATLWFSAVTSGPTAGLALPGDALWLDPSTATFSGLTTNVELLKSIPIPAASQLLHKQFVVQGVMVDPVTGALRTTNAKLVTLGY